jgi:hypothetical protein
MKDIFWKATEREAFEFFQNMTGEQAQAFLHQYLQLREERLAALNRRYWQTGGGNESDLDFISPDTLVPLWDWATKQLRRREFTPAELEHARSLPDSVRQSYKPPLSEDSLMLINDIAYYFAELLTRNLEGVHWEICKTKEKRYIDRNQPVLGGFSAPGFTLGLNPRSWVKRAAQDTLDGQAGEDALLRAYEKCSELVEEKTN